MRRLSVYLSRRALLTLCKFFVKTHLDYLDYGDILHDRPNNKNWKHKLKKVQDKACLALASRIQRMSSGKLNESKAWCHWVKDVGAIN